MPVDRERLRKRTKEQILDEADDLLDEQAKIRREMIKSVRRLDAGSSAAAEIERLNAVIADLQGRLTQAQDDLRVLRGESNTATNFVLPGASDGS